MSEVCILISVIVLVIIAGPMIRTGKSKKPKRLSKIAMLALLLIVLGIVLGEDRSTGYSLMGVGVVLAIIDIIKNLKKR